MRLNVSGFRTMDDHRDCIGTTMFLRKPHYRLLCKFRYRLQLLQLWAFRGLEMTIKPQLYLHIDQQRE